MTSRAWRRRSSSQSAAAYQGWTRYDRAPYRSVAYGRRFLNNYANEKARAYGRFENAGRLPVGPVIFATALKRSPGCIVIATPSVVRGEASAVAPKCHESCSH